MKKILFILSLLFTAQLNHSQWVQQKDYLPRWSVGWTIDACDSLNAVLYGSLNNQQGLFITYDGGKTWNPRIIPSGSIIDIEMIDQNNIVYGTGYGNIYRTSDSGITWNAVYGDTNVTNFINYIEFFSDHIGIAMGDGISTSNDLVDRPTILYTGTYGFSWSHIQTETLTGSYSGDTWRRIDFVNPNTGYFFSSGNIQKFWKTTDMGHTWFELNLNTRIDLLKFYDENIGLIVTYDKPPNPWRIMLTADGGNTWSQSIVNFSGWPNDIEFIPNDPNKIWFTNPEGLFYSSDMGITWTKQTLPIENVYGRDIVFADDKHGCYYVMTGYYFILITTAV